MVLTTLLENNPTMHPEVAFTRATAQADFLESKQIAPWQEPARFTIPAAQMQEMEAKAAAKRAEQETARDAELPLGN